MFTYTPNHRTRAATTTQTDTSNQSLLYLNNAFVRKFKDKCIQCSDNVDTVNVCKHNNCSCFICYTEYTVFRSLRNVSGNYPCDRRPRPCADVSICVNQPGGKSRCEEPIGIHRSLVSGSSYQCSCCHAHTSN